MTSAGRRVALGRSLGVGLIWLFLIDDD